MKNIVSFETAKKLEIAGFERPEIHSGQFWYDKISGDKICVILSKYDYIYAIEHQSLQFVTINTDDFKGFVYAPTATDLLEVLPNEYTLSKKSNEWLCGALIFHADLYEGYDQLYAQENAAEAVAEAYLSQSKQ
jgi:hypothetical protein